MAFMKTTRAYKRVKNGMFLSEIASRFKKTERHTPIDNSEDCPPPLRPYTADPFYYHVCYMRVLTRQKWPFSENISKEQDRRLCRLSKKKVQ